MFLLSLIGLKELVYLFREMEISHSVPLITEHNDSFNFDTGLTFNFCVLNLIATALRRNQAQSPRTLESDLKEYRS